MNTPTPDPRLQDLISQERALFRGEDDELDDEEFTDQQDTTFRLRTQIAAMPARS